MKIIMLSGPQSSGKTTTINMIYDELIDMYGAQPKEPRPFPKPENIRDYKDFEAILSYTKETGEKLKIAFASMGDSSLEVLHYMSFYEGKECDVLICACRNYFRHPFKRLNMRYEGKYQIINKNTPNINDNLRAMNEIKALI